MFNTIGYKQKKKKNHTKMKTDSQNLTYKTELEIYGYKESRSVLRLLNSFWKILCLPEKQLPCKQEKQTNK